LRWGVTQVQGRILGAVTVALAVLAVLGLIIHNQLSVFRTQISELGAQNSELERQISDLHDQIVELQDQNRQLKERIIELMEQSGQYSSQVKMIAFEWIGGFNPIGSLTLACPVNVTIRNEGDVEARGLSLTVKLINMYTGSQIGQSGGTDLFQIGKIGANIEPLSPGETREIRAYAYRSLSESLADAACVATLKLGNTVLDEWIRSIS
jgi:cell division protein FtsL